MPLIAERGYHLEFSDPGVTINNSILDVQGKFVVSSMQNGVRSAGTAEFSRVNAPPNYARANMLKLLSKRLLPHLQTENAHQWMGIRPSFPDNLPAIGEVPGYPALFTAFGHSHYGMGMAPATARMIADAVSEKSVNDDRSMYSIARFE